VDRYEYSLETILPHMPAKVSQITVQTVLNYRELRVAQVSPRTANMDVDTLSRMLNWAVSQGVTKSNPLQLIKPLRHDHPKEGRALEDTEVEALLGASPQHWYDVWYTFLVTGLRAGELISLRLIDVDWESRELIVRRGIAKNHRSRRIPIDGALWELLCQRRDGKGPESRVFLNCRGAPLGRSGLYHAFIRCCRRAGLETRREDEEGHERDHLDVHSLRKTFSTNLIVNGADPKTVQELLGHKSLAMTMNLYTKIHSGTKREGIGRLSYGAGTGTPAVIRLPGVS